MADKLPIFDPPTMQFEHDPLGDTRRPWVVLREQRFHNGVWSLTVPAGFRCDLASIPWFVRFAFNPNGAHQRAAVFHDAAYRLQTCSRFTADAAFRAILEHDNVSWWRTFILYYAVRLFGLPAWKENQES